MECLKVLALLVLLTWRCNCQGSQVSFSTEEDYEAENSVEDVTVSSEAQAEGRSTWKCNSPSGCIRFKATIYDLITTSNPIGSVRTVTLDPKRTYFNHQITELKQTFKVNKAVTETATLELSQAFRHVDSVEFEDKVLAIFQASESTAIRKLKAGLSTAFQIESSSKQTRRYGVAVKKLYKFERTVTVSYCEEYEISSVLEMMDNAKTTYKAELKITGEHSTGRKLKEPEIIASLDATKDGFAFLKGDPRGNETTAIATTDVNLIETYVDKNITNGKGKPIPECITAFTIYKANVHNLAKTSSNDGSKWDMTLTIKSSFHNTERKPEIHNVSLGNSEVSDTAEFEFPNGLSSMSSIGFESGAIAMLRASLPTPPKTKATDKLVQELPTAFQSGLTRHVVIDKRKHELKTTAPAPACMRDERWFVAKMVDNIETNYTIQVKVTSELKVVGIKFSADEIRGNLKDVKGLKFLADVEAFTAVAETTAKLIESYIDGVIVKNNLTKVEWCL